MNRLEGKVAIVTGGAQGMGASHATRFVSEGAKVIITDINEEAGKTLEKSLGKDAKFIKQDVTKKEDWDKVVKEANDTFGQIDILVNNDINLSKGVVRFLNHLVPIFFFSDVLFDKF